MAIYTVGLMMDLAFHVVGRRREKGEILPDSCDPAAHSFNHPSVSLSLRTATTWWKKGRATATVLTVLRNVRARGAWQGRAGCGGDSTASQVARKAWREDV